MLTNSTEAAQAGTRSLKTTGRTQGFHGPSLNVFGALIKGATYQVTVSVRLVAGQAPTTVRVTVQRTPAGSGNQIDTVASSASGAQPSRVPDSNVEDAPSDQPQNGTGDGDTDIDWEIIDAHHIRLRSERAPTSTAGRTYTIIVKVTDSAGTSSSSAVTVVVPR